MIGNRVKIVFTRDIKGERENPLTGTLHSLDITGALIWRENVMPEQQCNVFIPTHRIHEIVDLGRVP